MKEALVLACECGATIKCSDLDGVTTLACEKVWQEIHGQHEQVDCVTAKKIRDAEKALRNKARQWWEGDDEVPTTGKYTYMRPVQEEAK